MKEMTLKYSVSLKDVKYMLYTVNIQRPLAGSDVVVFNCWHLFYLLATILNGNVV